MTSSEPETTHRRRVGAAPGALAGAGVGLLLGLLFGQVGRGIVFGALFGLVFGSLASTERLLPGKRSRRVLWVAVTVVVAAFAVVSLVVVLRA